MTKFRARVEVRLRRQDYDPEAETVKKSLLDLNFPVSETKIAKVYEIGLDAASLKEAESIARLICLRLLVNPTKDEFKIEVAEVGTPISRTTS
jgi:phosphoribosylformylglycinamidine synthase subunit PurS